MSDILDEQGEVNWKIVIDQLSEGRAVEIPCAKEREFVRRATQVVKRAEKQNLAVEVLRGESALRIEPRASAARANEVVDSRDGLASREARQRERVERREALRAERGAERDRER